MGIRKKRSNGLRLLAAMITCAAIFAATSWGLKNAAAQNSGVSSSKSATPRPASEAKSAANKPISYIVAKGQIVKEILLTGELKAARSTSIATPNIRSSFANTVSFLALEGTIVKKGERIVEFDDSSLLSQKSEAERVMDEAKLAIEKKKTDLEADRCDP